MFVLREGGEGDDFTSFHLDPVVLTALFRFYLLRVEMSFKKSQVLAALLGICGKRTASDEKLICP
jgi:hypothetical protein